MRGRLHPPVSSGTEVVCLRDVAGFDGDSGECVQSKDFDVGVVVATRLLQDHRKSVSGVGLQSNRRGKRRSGSRILSDRTQHAPEMHTRERGQTYVTGRLGLDDREFERVDAAVVVTGLALGAPETRKLVRLRLPKPESLRCFCGASEVYDGVVESSLDARQLAEHGVATNVEPRIIDNAEPVLDMIDRFDAPGLVIG